MKHAARQTAYAERQQREPSLANLKHLLDTETYYVYGRILDPDGSHAGGVVAVAAYANAYGKTELVDIMHNARVGTHYGLNIPRAEGKTFQLLALQDKDGNGRFDRNEVVGEGRVTPQQRVDAGRVLGNIDIELSPKTTALIPEPVPVRHVNLPKQSLYYPGGTIRDLDDPIFDRDMATLGMYEPAAFTERAPTMFYALEEEVGHRIPVIFVHGMAGTAREFEPLVRRLDRTRFKAWFFHYPSGARLEQLAELFFGIFLSGEAVQPNPMVPTVIVAHSMGGLVVREALNLIDAHAGDGVQLHFISIASPLAGHPSAAMGVNNGMLVVPSWHSLNPDSEFIRRLYRRPLPEMVDYHLVYAYRDDGMIRLGENSDGVVPLSSQLRREAQAESSLQRGFNATHVGILNDPEALDFLVQDIHNVQTRFPPEHMQWLLKGGFVVEGETSHGPRARHAIETVGQYIQALSLGTIAPVTPEQRHFIDVVEGRTPPQHDLERAWLEFVEHNPNPSPKPPP